jgi:hypothetical protein
VVLNLSPPFQSNWIAVDLTIALLSLCPWALGRKPRIWFDEWISHL